MIKAYFLDHFGPDIGQLVANVLLYLLRLFLGLAYRVICLPGTLSPGNVLGYG